jgi:hypothetical protein
MKRSEEVRKLVATDVVRMVVRLRSALSGYHAGELEALERIARQEFVDTITTRVMEKLGD